MSIKIAALGAALLLAGGCAQNGTLKPPQEPDVSSPVAGTAAGGAAALAMQTPAGASAGHSGAAAM